jgi:hypothetical protein
MTLPLAIQVRFGAAAQPGGNQLANQVVQAGGQEGPTPRPYTDALLQVNEAVNRGDIPG